MGVDVQLKREDGTVIAEVGDPQNAFGRALPEPVDSRFPYLSCVDRYGDTVFNRLQATQLISELKALPLSSSDSQTRAIVDAIIALAERLQRENHTYLWFVGD